jgi:pimeloyl-ACP methyl ester carboxylesterase
MIDVPNGQLNVVADGPEEGRPVVLIHAGIADLRAWDQVVPYLTAARFRSIRFDMRGYGRSRTEDVEFYPADDVIAVMDHYGLESSPIVGNSFGGMIAFDTALAYPTRVSALVSVAGGIAGFWEEPPPEEQTLIERMESLEEDAAADVREIVRMDLDFWVEGPGQRPGRADSKVRSAVEEMDFNHWTNGKPHGRPTFRDREAAKHVDQLRIPVLAVAGSLDASGAVGPVQFLEENAPNARAVVIPGVAHMIGMEVPEHLAKLITDFFTNV